MECPFCKHQVTKVIDKRDIEEGKATRRRRECEKCSRRWTTYERAEIHSLIVVKKDATREQFSREKVRLGMVKSCEKRPVTSDQITKASENVERALKLKGKVEVKSREVGEQVMKQLKRLDKVAYIRFASVYKDFEDPEEFERLVTKLRPRRS